MEFRSPSFLGMFLFVAGIGAGVMLLIMGVSLAIYYAMSDTEIILDAPIEPVRIEVIDNNGVKDTLYIYEKF